MSDGQQKKRGSARPEEGLSLQEILQIEVPQDRVERLKQLTTIDAPGVTDEIHTWLVRQQAQWANIQYTRFLAGTKYTEQDIDEILAHSIDTHVHGGSDPFERLLLEDDIGKDFTDVGARAMVVKTWYTPSASRNALVQKIVDLYAAERGLRPTQCFGGVTLNYSQGGFNADAVRKCLGFPGMKYVWMPMVDSYHHRRVVYDDWSGLGLDFLDEKRKVIPEVKEILRILAENDLILGTGHYPYADSAILIDEAREQGVHRFEIIHPAHIHSKHTIAQMQEQAARGAKLMLSGLGAMAFPLHESGPLYAARIVKEVGPENIVYGSDLGQFQNMPHMIANRWMVKLLLAYGCTKEELRTVFQVTPAEHLGLEPPPSLGTPAHPGQVPADGDRRYAGHPQADPLARARSWGMSPPAGSDW
jgi:predicted TIM-barrel fold metal-dependent hydrolase